MKNKSPLLARLYWAVQVHLCRRFMATLTVDKIAVLAHVTGTDPAVILQMHAGCRRRQLVNPPTRDVHAAA